MNPPSRLKGGLTGMTCRLRLRLRKIPALGILPKINAFVEQDLQGVATT